MLRIVAKEYSQAVSVLCAKLEKEGAQFDVYLAQSAQAQYKCVSQSIKNDAMFLVGDVGNWCVAFADIFGLALVYDKFAEKSLIKYCELAGQSLPPQYVMDKYCQLPETFIHYAAVYGAQCGCVGEFQKCHVYILPDDEKECEVLFDNYISKDLFKSVGDIPLCCYKVFGLNKRDVDEKLSKLNNKLVSQHCETKFLDSKITFTFPRNCTKKVVSEYLEGFLKEFHGYVYADCDRSLQATVVAQLKERYQKVATAESITGGMIVSSLVEVPGASDVVYEGVATYTVDSKCRRLGISPHYIDEYGVVSAQVAKEMAIAQLKFADFSVATTGFAGPTSDGVNPVGLCYIGIGTKVAGKAHVRVFKNVFKGDRNAIRNQVCNTALFLLSNALSNSQFFAKV